MRFLLFAVSVLSFSMASIAQSRPIATYDADALMARIANPDTTYIVNFWATWCAPCVKELPEFDKLERMSAGKPVKVILVSLDFREDAAHKLPTFVQRRKLKPEVVWFSETDANEFIPKIDTRWGGSIPATLIVGDGSARRRAFLEGSITATQIAQMLALEEGSR